MVTVDMSTARAQITKRQRRMRRAAQRRLQKQQKAQLREHRAAEAARQARQRAIAGWNAEEDRLQSLRDNHTKPSDSPNPNPPASRVVKFAQNVMVTEIPVADADKLPKPVTSPICVSICGTDHSDADTTLSCSNASEAVLFAQFSEADFADDDDDPEFAPDEPVKVNTRTTPIQRPRRRIIAKRLDVPLDQITPDDRSSKSKHSSPAKRPRSENSPPSKSSPTANGLEEDGHLHAKPSLEHDSMTKTGKSSRRKIVPEAVSPSDQTSSKRRRVQNADHESPREKKRKTGDSVEYPKQKIGANGVNRSADKPDVLQGNRKGVKEHNRGGPRSETPGEPLQTDRVLLISSTKNDGRKKRTSQQSSPPKNKSKRCAKQSTSIAQRDSPGKKSKLNGLHSAIPYSDQRQKPSESEDDQDLDNMFGNLVKMKAANRVIHEKKASVEKLSQNGDDSNSASAVRAKSNTRKTQSRYTQDGLRIMTYEEIAADQPPGLNGECPFDCSCCF